MDKIQIVKKFMVPTGQLFDSEEKAEWYIFVSNIFKTICFKDNELDNITFRNFESLLVQLKSKGLLTENWKDKL